MTERVRLMRDGIIHYSGILVSGLAAIVLVPVLVAGLGAESYGLWVAALTTSGMVAFVDFGLAPSISRQVSGGLRGVEREETIRFLRAAGTAYLLIGLVGGALIVLLGFVLRGDLHLSSSAAAVAPWVFALAALAYLGERIQSYGFAVLVGLRRFDFVNLVMIGFAIARAGGMIVLILLGYGLVSAAAWHAAATVLAAWMTVMLVGWREPALRWRIGRLHWASLRGHVSFGLFSQLLLAATNTVWQTAPLLIGLVLGSAWITPFHIGMKFPTGVWLLSWRAAEVLFPAASEQGRQNGLGATRGIFEVGTRWILLLVLPFCLVFIIAAPNLLQAWLGALPGRCGSGDEAGCCRRAGGRAGRGSIACSMGTRRRAARARRGWDGGGPKYGADFAPFAALGDKGGSSRAVDFVVYGVGIPFPAQRPGLRDPSLPAAPLTAQRTLSARSGMCCHGAGSDTVSSAVGLAGSDHHLHTLRGSLCRRVGVARGAGRRAGLGA